MSYAPVILRAHARAPLKHPIPPPLALVGAHVPGSDDAAVRRAVAFGPLELPQHFQGPEAHPRLRCRRPGGDRHPGHHDAPHPMVGAHRSRGHRGHLLRRDALVQAA